MTAPHLEQLSAQAIAAGLNTHRVGRRIMVLDCVDSTNTYALDQLTAGMGPVDAVLGVLMPAEAADGTAVFAEEQTAGRGRLGRRWHSPRGASLLVSVLLSERAEPLSTARLILGAAVAVVDAITETTDVEPMIRWPNDVYIGSKKLAGILVERRGPSRSTFTGPGAPPHTAAVNHGRNGGVVAVGIGINCLQHAGHFPAEVRQVATSLELESQRPIDRTALAQSLLRHLDHQYAETVPSTDEDLFSAWRRRSADIGSRATLLTGDQTHTGIILDVDPQGGLLVQLDTGARMHFDPERTTRHSP